MKQLLEAEHVRAASMHGRWRQNYVFFLGGEIKLNNREHAEQLGFGCIYAYGSI